MPNNKVLNSEQIDLSRLQDFDKMTLEEMLEYSNRVFEMRKIKFERAVKKIILDIK